MKKNQIFKYIILVVYFLYKLFKGELNFYNREMVFDISCISFEEYQFIPCDTNGEEEEEDGKKNECIECFSLCTVFYILIFFIAFVMMRWKCSIRKKCCLIVVAVIFIHQLNP